MEFSVNEVVKSLVPAMGSETSQKIYQRLPTVAVVLLLLLIAWASAQLVWQILTPNTPMTPTAPNGGPSTSNTTTPNYASQIAQRSLFGKSNSEAAPEQEEQDAPDTRLNLKLLGVYALDDPKKGYAMIANGARPEELVLVGGKLPGNVKLHSVYPDRVILSRAGKRETLRLPATEKTGISRSPAKPRRPNNRSSSGSTPSNLADFRNQMLKNPAKLAELVNAAPARENGKFIGYRITQLKQHPILSQVDIQSGDIITRVNGVDISSPASGMKALQKLSKEDSVQLTLNRGGQVIEVTQTF